MQQKQQQILRQQDGPASPLMLGGKAAPEIDVPVVQLDTLQPRRATTTAARDSSVEPKKKRSAAVKRRKISETASVETTSTNTDTTSRRRSLRRQAKRKNSYREEHGSSGSEPDDDRDEDVDPNDLELPEEETNIYVPARERATMWAKSVLQHNDDDDGENKDGETSQALVVRDKKAKRAPTRRKRSNSTASSIVSLVGGGGLSARNKMEELLKKEPSQMTMGELALTVPKGRRMKRYEREEAATSADTPLLNSSSSTSGEGSSSLLNMNALNRVRSLSVSSESAAFAGSLVTPQVQIIDGQMVVLESTIKLGDELQHTADVLGGGSIGDDNTGLPPRHSGSRYNSSHQNTPGKRWGKEETKQFYYCLSQAKSPLELALSDDQDADETASVMSSSTAASPMSSSMLTPVAHAEEFVETMNDEDLFLPNRRDSFDFSG
ncbi:hypothetical protein BBJ29_004145 [Phytophthora kernoviae]|uniref:Uncharacterized protein n=1 Tax=Phytophthora kernoviae TaxID=325452 RepID=A0A421G1E5_9STRA|nr:hypothetical protein BBJ29_004145 [Phytophthora kernoviae]